MTRRKDVRQPAPDALYPMDTELQRRRARAARYGEHPEQEVRTGRDGQEFRRWVYTYPDVGGSHATDPAEREAEEAALDAELMADPRLSDQLDTEWMAEHGPKPAKPKPLPDWWKDDYYDVPGAETKARDGSWTETDILAAIKAERVREQTRLRKAKHAAKNPERTQWSRAKDNLRSTMRNIEKVEQSLPALRAACEDQAWFMTMRKDPKTALAQAETRLADLIERRAKWEREVARYEKIVAQLDAEAGE